MITVLFPHSSSLFESIKLNYTEGLADTSHLVEFKYLSDYSGGVDVYELPVAYSHSTETCLSYVNIENAYATINAMKRVFMETNTLSPAPVNNLNYDILYVTNSKLSMDIFNSTYENEFDQSKLTIPIGHVIPKQSCNLYLNNYPIWSWSTITNIPSKNIVWVGMISGDKGSVYSEFISYCKSNNITPTVVSKKITPPDLGWNIDYVPFVPNDELPQFLTQFEYGVGVGRSYLDMAVLGLKVINAGVNKGDQTTEFNIQNKIYENFATHQYPTSKSFDELVGDAVSIRDLIMSELPKTRFQNQFEAIINA